MQLVAVLGTNLINGHGLLERITLYTLVAVLGTNLINGHWFTVRVAIRRNESLSLEPT